MPDRAVCLRSVCKCVRSIWARFGLVPAKTHVQYIGVMVFPGNISKALTKAWYQLCFYCRRQGGKCRNSLHLYGLDMNLKHEQVSILFQFSVTH